MKDYKEMAQSVLARAKRYNVRRKSVIRGIVGGGLCCCVAVMLALAAAGRTAAPATEPTQGPGIDLSDLQFQENFHISALYDKGYKTIGELMAISPLVVRATPAAVESESDVAICWVLELAEASAPGTETIYLRQLKDEYLLTQGQEYVLVLQEDYGENYFNIPGGGCGLFYIDPQTRTPEGKLLDSLLESSAHAGTDLTLEEVFDLLLQHLP